MKQRAFVRYTKSGKIIPGSMIMTNGSYPQGYGLCYEVQTNLCCDPTPGVDLLLLEESVSGNTMYIAQEDGGRILL